MTVSSGSRFSSSIPSRESSFLRKNRTSDGVATSGDVPIERFGAALVALGERRLAVIGGLTVSEGIDKSGLVFDEFCVSFSVPFGACSILESTVLEGRSVLTTGSLHTRQLK